MRIFIGLLSKIYDKFNWLQGGLLFLALIFVVLLLVKRKWAAGYARYTILALAAIVILMPFYWLMAASFKDKDYLNEYTFLPPPPTWFKHWAAIDAKGAPVTDEHGVALVKKPTLSLDNYRTLFSPKQTLEGPITFTRHVVNSIFLAGASTFITLFFSSLGGFALAKYKFPGRQALVVFMLASVTIPGVVMLVPNYQTIYRLGWLDTYWALLVPGAVSVFGIFLFRQAMVAVPDELVEAARIDGCGEFMIYLKLVMPLVRPMSGAFCLISFLGSWNSYLSPSIFLQTASKMPLPVILNQYIGEYQQQYGVFLAGTLLAIVPPAILFLVLQKEFISGLTSGAVKG